MIELHQFAPAWGLNISPFCLKVETYLRLAKLPFRPVVSVPFKGPKGKLPFIVDGSQRIADSGFIIDHLKRTHGDMLDAELSSESRALGHVIRRTCEESLYFAILYSRWVDETNWQVIRPAIFAGLPPVVRDVVPGLIRRRVRQALIGQGTGRHTADEVYALGRADIDALAALLGDRPFFLGDKPTSVDACAYAFLVNLIRAPIADPLKAAACGHERRRRSLP